MFFQNDNINTLDEDSELRLTIMSGIAQDELRKLSSRVRFGHQQDLSKRMAELRHTVEIVEKKKQKLLTFNAMGQLSDRDFLAMNKQCEGELEKAQRELAELEGQRDSASDFKKHIDTIRRVLQEAERDAANGLINKEFVEQYIDKIFATPEEDGSLRLQIKIFTGETTDK